MFLEIADRIHGVTQLVGKTFGFLNPADSTIEDGETADGRHIARFTSPDPGWPALDVELPGSARFEHGITGVLCRSGGWICSESPEEVRAFIDARSPSLGLTWRRGRMLAGSATLPDGVKVKVSLMASSRGTFVAIQQTRTESGLKQSMTTRLRRHRRRPV